MASTRALSTARRSRSVHSNTADSVTRSSRPLVDGGRAGELTTPARACGGRWTAGLPGRCRAPAGGQPQPPRPVIPSLSRLPRGALRPRAPVGSSTGAECARGNRAPDGPSTVAAGSRGVQWAPLPTAAPEDAVTTVDPRPGAAARPALRSTGAPARGKVAAFVALTKPRIIELLLVTTVPTMVFAAGGLPPLGLVAATLVGGTLAAASANTLNCYLDRDIDVLMHRTERRPLVTGEVTPRQALVFGTGLGIASVGLLAGLVNVLSAALALGAILFYVVVYTMLLKRRTPQNIVWGGAAGCMPVLIGWSAVTGG